MGRGGERRAGLRWVLGGPPPQGQLGEAGHAGGRANRHALREPDTGGRSGEARKIPFFPLPTSLQRFLPEKLNIMPSGKGKMFEQAQIPLPRAGKKVNLELEAINRLLP